MNSVAMETVKKHPQILEFNTNVKEDLEKLNKLDNGRMEQSVDILEEWIKKQTHFVNKNFCREYLESVLIRCKGSVKKSKLQIDKLCTLRTLLPKYFVSDLRPVLSQITGLVKLVILPKMTKQHDRICYIQLCFKDETITSSAILYFIQYILAIAQYLINFDCVNSFIMIYDLRDADLLMLVKSLNLTDLHNLITIGKKGFSSRISAIHFLSSNVIDLLLNIVIPIMSSKLAARIQCHATVEDLSTVLDRENLPTDLGGKQGLVDDLQGKWVELMCSEDVKPFLAERIASCTDESLRPKDTFNEDSMGVPGSFRSLSFD